LRSLCWTVLLYPVFSGQVTGQPVAEPQSAGEYASVANYEPTTNYRVEHIAGWKVYFHARLLKDKPDLAARVRRELTRQLEAIVTNVPADKVESLRKTSIWVEHFHPQFPCACYHPDVRWLRSNGFNPDKVDSVDISNPQNFVDWSRDQPWMMLHELAHGYHDQVLGYDHQGIRRAYERAKASGNYEKVKHVNGDTVRHYALNNDQEYFAEITEAYFGKNDFFPFIREDLKKLDPEGYALMHDVWGQ
jgi:hypothetical protein